MTLSAANDNPLAYRTTAFSGDNEWYSPSRYVDMAREVMGGIDVDPASNAIAQVVVRAGVYYTAETNGLDKPWPGRVWLNPPYATGLVGPFCDNLVEEFRAGRCVEAIVLTNNATDTRWFSTLAGCASAFCFTRGRVKFESPTRQTASPAMGQTFSYLGTRPDRFADVFGAVGHVLTPPPSRAAIRLAA